MDWVPIEAEIPRDTVLLYVQPNITIGVYVDSDDGDGVFMDSGAYVVLPWPTHWMRLPDPPGD